MQWLEIHGFGKSISGRRNQEMGRMKGFLFSGFALLLLAVPLLGACTKEVVKERPIETEVVTVETPEVVTVETTDVISEVVIKRFIEVNASTDKGAFLPGEDIVIELSFENASGETLQITPFPPDTRIRRPRTYKIVEGPRVDTHAGPTPTPPLANETLGQVRIFPAGTGTKSLDPGEVASFVVTWDQRDDQGQQVTYGHFKLVVGEFCAGDRCMTHDPLGSVQLLILPEEGVMEKTVEVNESQTVNDVTITLQRVELTALDARFYALYVPPDYVMPEQPFVPGTDSPQGVGHAPVWMMQLDPSAEYSLDGGPMKDAGPSGLGFLENGIRNSWASDPVPNGTKELTFVITKLGEWEGPWKFRVSLE
jgi:hypothetical protein